MCVLRLRVCGAPVGLLHGGLSVGVCGRYQSPFAILEVRAREVETTDAPGSYFPRVSIAGKAESEIPTGHDYYLRWLKAIKNTESTLSTRGDYREKLPANHRRAIFRIARPLLGPVGPLPQKRFAQRAIPRCGPGAGQIDRAQCAPFAGMWYLFVSWRN